LAARLGLEAVALGEVPGAGDLQDVGIVPDGGREGGEGPAMATIRRAASSRILCPDERLISIPATVPSL
jgi:hypothetical protein